MGVQDFHDLDRSTTAHGAAEETHVRGIYEDTGDRLQEALDAFVLTGALKLYRADHGVPEGPFRHHTMLVHESVTHGRARGPRPAHQHPCGTRRRTPARRATPASRPCSTTDFQRFADDALPTPDLVRRPASRTSPGPASSSTPGGNPVIVVNGDTERDYAQPDLDFDRTPNVWKILVGGTKLSRGFTVEGLTVTYYRRTTQQADTLMQMGRWFGFRPGYRDLVRLYIGREEPMGKRRRSTCTRPSRRSAATRRPSAPNCTRYADLVDGKPQVTPAQIPPLVSQHLPWLKPSARNKMFNAELVEIRSPGQADRTRRVPHGCPRDPPQHRTLAPAARRHSVQRLSHSPTRRTARVHSLEASPRLPPRCPCRPHERPEPT